VYWEVVQLDNIKVQHVNNISFASTDLSLGQTITALAATNKAFAYVTGRGNTATNTLGGSGFYRGNITSTTNVNVIRGITGSVAGSATLQVVEFTDATTVEHITVTGLTAVGNPQTLGTSVNTAKAYSISNFTQESATSTLNACICSYVSGSTTVTAFRGNTIGSTSSVDIYVVSPADATATSVSSASNSLPGATTIANTIANVTDTSKAWTFNTFSSAGSGSAWASEEGAGQLTSTTNVNTLYQNTTNTRWYGLQVMQAPVGSGDELNLMTMGIGS
jgi:hypothetical protein